MAATAAAMAKAKPKKYDWQNRIVGHGEKPAQDFVANDHNWRTHNSLQRKAINGILAEIGWVQAVIVNVNTGRIVDGHMRVEEALQNGTDTPVPFIEVDLSLEEEKLLLTLFDPIGTLAGQDIERYKELTESLEIRSENLTELLDHLNEHIHVPEFREFDESVETEVEFVTCPKCEHRFPK